MAALTTAMVMGSVWTNSASVFQVLSAGTVLKVSSDLLVLIHCEMELLVQGFVIS